jgi:hypothetical protein
MHAGVPQHPRALGVAPLRVLAVRSVCLRRACHGRERSGRRWLNTSEERRAFTTGKSEVLRRAATSASPAVPGVAAVHQMVLFVRKRQSRPYLTDRVSRLDAPLACTHRCIDMIRRRHQTLQHGYDFSDTDEKQTLFAN